MGQELSVYRFTRIQPAVKQQISYKRELVGAVRITGVVDEHYAKAIVLKGDIRANDVAELSP